MIKRILVPVIIYFITSLNASLSATTIHIVAVNDVHAALDNFPRFAAIVDSLRETDPHLLVFSAGDNRTGNPYNDYCTPPSLPMVEMMNITGFDATALGNHDYDSGVKNLSTLISKSHFTYLAANLTTAPALGINTLPHKTFDVKGVTVGVLGITQVAAKGIPDTHPSNVVGMEFELPEDVIPRYQGLAEKCDVNILLSHVGYDNDLDLAQRFPYYDVIIGGHSHRQLDGGELHNGVLITQNANKLHKLTLITLEVENGKVINKKAENIDINESGAKDMLVSNMLDFYKSNRQLDSIVAQVPRRLETRQAVGIMMAHSWACETMSQIGLVNHSSVPVDYIPAGEFRVADAYKLDPFMNSPVIITLTGRELLNLILGCYNFDKHHMPYLSGCRLTVSATGVDDLSVEHLDMQNPDGTKMDLNRSYRLVTSNYVARKTNYLNRATVLPGTAGQLILNYLKSTSVISFVEN